MALRVTIAGRSREAMLDLVRRHRVDVLENTVRKLADGTLRVDAVLPTARVGELGRAGYAVTVLQDIEQVAALRRREIQWHPSDKPVLPGPTG